MTHRSRVSERSKRCTGGHAAQAHNALLRAKESMKTMVGIGSCECVVDDTLLVFPKSPMPRIMDGRKQWLGGMSYRRIPIVIHCRGLDPNW